MTTEQEFRLRDVALAAYGPSVVISVGHGAVMPVLALRARDLGADVGTAALVVGLLGVGMLVASLPAGSLIARVGEKRALLLAGLLDAAAMGAAALTDSVLGLGLAVVVSGMAWTTFLISRQGFMIEAVPPAYRARALSGLGGTYRIGVFVGPLIGALLIDWTGLTAVFVLALVMSLVAAAMATLMPDLGSESRAEQGAAGPPVGLVGAGRPPPDAADARLRGGGARRIPLDPHRAATPVGRVGRHLDLHDLADLRPGRLRRHRVLLPGRVGHGPLRAGGRRRPRRAVGRRSRRCCSPSPPARRAWQG